MSLSAAVLRELMAAGLSGDALLAACERIEAAAPEVVAKPERTARQERNARYYASKKRLKASYSDGSDDFQTLGPGNAPARPRADLEPTTQETSYPKTPLKGVKKGEVPAPIAKPKSADAECVAELGKVLDADRAQAVVDHRNRIRKPMTAYAAGRLALSLSQAPDPNAAADEMIERGWQGWKPDWGRGSQGPPRQASNRRSLIEALDRMIPDEHQPQPSYPRLAFGG